jgi:hypothetical protein
MTKAILFLLLILPTICLAQEKKVCEIKFINGKEDKYVIFEMSETTVKAVPYEKYVAPPYTVTEVLKKDEIASIKCDGITYWPPSAGQKQFYYPKDTTKVVEYKPEKVKSSHLVEKVCEIKLVNGKEDKYFIFEMSETTVTAVPYEKYITPPYGRWVVLKTDEIVSIKCDGITIWPPSAEQKQFYYPKDTMEAVEYKLESTPAKVKSWYIGLGALGFYHSYQEPGIMKESGWCWLKGARLFLRHDGTKSVFALELEGALASITYNGGIQYAGGNSVPLLIKHVNDKFAEVRFLAGKPLKSNQKSVAILYSGIGARFWFDDLTASIYGYKRESRYIYSPLGIEFWFWGNSGVAHGSTLEYDFLWRGRQVSRFSEYDAINKQRKGYGLRLSLQIKSTKLLKTETVVEGYIRYWKIAKSDVTFVNSVEGYVPVYEPENRTIQIGFSLKGFLPF